MSEKKLLQVWIDRNLDRLIRGTARAEHRSISATVSLILEKHFGDCPAAPGRTPGEPNS